MDLVGYSGGMVRAPLQVPDEEARQEIRSLIRAAGAM
jgi:hypothetical protein